MKAFANSVLPMSVSPIWPQLPRLVPSYIIASEMINKIMVMIPTVN